VQIQNPSSSAKIHSLQLLQNKQRRGLLCFVSLQLFVKAFSTFHVRFVKIIGPPKRCQNKKRFVKKFLKTLQTFITSMAEAEKAGKGREGIRNKLITLK